MTATIQSLTAKGPAIIPHAPAAARCAGPGTIAECLCPIVSNDAVNGEYRLMMVQANEIALSAVPGQFFHLLCPASEAGHPFLRRPMSIYRIDRQAGQIGFLYKVEGKGTQGLATLRRGEVLNALGPLGRGFRLPEGTRHVLMVARGVGLATLAPLAGMAQAQGARATAWLSARHPDLSMSRDELEAAGAEVIEVTDTDGGSDPARMRAAMAERHAADPFDFAATCGSNRLFHLVQGLCRDWGIPGQTALEARMGCGTGMCYACVVPVNDADGGESYSRVCWDGPVFSMTEAKGW
ncbi:MAG: dihydroorotate dehydrogenase electron transfer subunit [Paracoccaceae bacterium]